jgi:hypothetical protein
VLAVMTRSSCGYLCKSAVPQRRAVRSTFDLLGCASNSQCRKPRALHRNNGTTWLTSTPSSSDEIVTTSPILWVKPWPETSRSCTGANMLPR